MSPGRERPNGLLLLWTLLGLAAACTGDGSDVGPTLDPLPEDSRKVLVLDNAGRGVSAARVTIGSAVAVTGRSGRADLLTSPLGRLLVHVAADAATATATDRLASLSFAATFTDRDLPFAVFLPDVSTSAAAIVPTGVALPATTVDDTAVSGARLLLAAGTVVADGAAATATLRLGLLAREHLPGPLPSPPAGVHLVGRGIWVDPPSATFAPGATLEVPDDLLLPAAATAELWHLDQITGEWVLVPGTATSSGGRLQLVAGVERGGLYAHAIALAAAATVRGRILELDEPDDPGDPVPDVLVRADGGITTTDDDGRFVATVAGEFADGSARGVLLDLRGGGEWLPVGITATTAALGAGADSDLGVLRLDTVPVSNVRVQMVERGRAETLRRLTHSSVNDLTAGVAFTDARGQCTIEEVPSEFFGFLNGHLFNREEIFVAESTAFMQAGRRWDELRAFFDDRNWLNEGRSSRTQALDSIGGGPVRDASVVSGSVAGSGFEGTTEDGGVVFIGRAGGRATVTVKTERGAASIVSGFSIERPNGEHLEMPLQRLLRPPGAFDRHGTVAGVLNGFVPASQQRVRASRPLEFDEWFDEVLLFVPPTSAVPVRTGAPLPQGLFRAGVALPQGHVAVAEGTVAGPVFTLTGIGLLTDLVVAEGTVAQLDLPIDKPAATAFPVARLLEALDPGFTAADLRFDLALQQPSGRIVDVARGVGGNVVPTGNDASLLLPALTGSLAGHSWLAALSASVQSGGTAAAQRSFVRLDGVSTPAVPQLPLPTITSPQDGGVVAAAGFTVDYALPAGSLYGTIDLLSPGAQALQWQVVVPPDLVQFPFVRLPVEAQTPLVAGRTYTLTVTAYRVDSGDVLLQQDPYREMATNWQVIGAGERGVAAFASRTITITTN